MKEGKGASAIEARNTRLAEVIHRHETFSLGTDFGRVGQNG